ncbi:hypothetical protein [Microbacterium sp. NIBRBAC000506063]|uniref:hypothetical protein n=1 Tax=Microbacterium sp. NIBRBAC000506063 TaxID=2734618 RepID=UPI001CB704D4|nr:hypothetical protein [Microbacterium sp. NIBRBAC000506063]
MRDLRSYLGMHRIQSAVQRGDRVIHLDELLPRQATRVIGARPRIIEERHPSCNAASFDIL